MAIRFWLGVAQREQVLRSVHQGMAQASQAARATLAGMGESDGLVYYSPKTAFEGEVLREFTAIARITDAALAPIGDPGSEFQPWRRRADYDPHAVATSIRPLLSVLELTRGNPNWGYQLRRGLIEISRHDFEMIRQQMRRPSADDL
ncbi:EVE domain-containing protein [Cryobacterium sp. CG_9.6]|uniref:EVE domain-containing protein n=1 Tax=Cryobacterium sp. CG_9.6 TaxID=2760710 RepID=UPI00247324CA|nr:EVE domain-containing protein [Cryobacterium sp. CG_9.6]MDH6238079.1 hypothetical protein [Cryobacterium sp. CG_9.6]